MRPSEVIFGMGDVIDEMELKQTMERMKKELQPMYTNSLAVKFHEPDYELGVGMIPGYYPYYYLAEVQKSYWLGFIPRYEFRMLVAVSAMFFKRDEGLKEITAGVFDPITLDVVMKELDEYKKATHASGITIQHQYRKSSQ